MKNQRPTLGREGGDRKMRVQKYLLAGMMAALMLSAAGCGSKAEKEAETAAPGATATAGTEQMQEQEKTSESVAADDQGDTATGDLAELIGEKGAKLFEELSEEERAALIPDTEVTGMGYYIDEYGEHEEYELTGCMKEYEVIQQDWECIVAKGVIENQYLKTENPVEVTYFFSVNEDETAVILTSPSIMTEADSVHVVPVFPVPEAEELLNMKMVAHFRDGVVELTKESVTGIRYIEIDAVKESDCNYKAEIGYFVNGKGLSGSPAPVTKERFADYAASGTETFGKVTLCYAAYEDRSGIWDGAIDSYAKNGWCLDRKSVGEIEE